MPARELTLTIEYYSLIGHQDITAYEMEKETKRGSVLALWEHLWRRSYELLIENQEIFDNERPPRYMRLQSSELWLDTFVSKKIKNVAYNQLKTRERTAMLDLMLSLVTSPHALTVWPRR